MAQASVQAVLQVQTEGVRDEHPLSKTTIEIGRRADSDIVLDDRRVSPCLCRLACHQLTFPLTCRRLESRQ